MKNKVLFLGLMTFFFALTNCSVYDKAKYKELFSITDKYVSSFVGNENNSSGESKELSKDGYYKEVTADGYYQVISFDGLINIKIMDAVDKDVYEKLMKSLKAYYKNNKIVNEVYICQTGTIIIDCELTK